MKKRSKKLIPKYVKIGKFLQIARKKAGLSQGDMKNILGYQSPQIISDWERGICGVPLTSIKQVLEAYKMKEETFVTKWLEAHREELEKLFKGKKN
ncbi:MAG: hypothetical protein A4S09_07275 [Proteobacteria bacterium SG_bin7]|nr:MAG: hypothetical protein A4S09_07275 [Proteobacteria bacterium SG_bin7]